MSFSVSSARSATPGCESSIFLNNAGSSLPTKQTLDAVIGHLTAESTMGGYAAGDAAAEQIEMGRRAAASLLNASPSEIAFTTSDTGSFVKAFWGLAFSGWFKPGDVVLTDALSYNSHHVAMLQATKLFGITVKVTADRTDISDSVRMVAFTHVGMHDGAITDLAKISTQTNSLGIPFFLDACQSIGQVPVDVEQIGCDVATMTGRKWLRGPRGTGLLYVRGSWLDRLSPPGLDGHSTTWTGPDEFRANPDSTRFEEFETSVAAKVGLASALCQLQELGMDAVHSQIQSISSYARDQLSGIAGVTISDAPGPRSGIVTFRMDNIAAAEIAARALEANIRIGSTVSAWTSAENDAPTPVVRVSPHIYNTEAEIDQLVDVVQQLSAR
jgi:cysteine desulfurase / selenocysteine lyase